MYDDVRGCLDANFAQRFFNVFEIGERVGFSIGNIRPEAQGHEEISALSAHWVRDERRGGRLQYSPTWLPAYSWKR